MITDEDNFVKIYLRPVEEAGCCRSRKVRQMNDTSEPDVRMQIGKFNTRNLLSFKPTDFEHDYPIQVTQKIINNSKAIETEIFDSLQADYVIVTEEAFAGDQKVKIIEN